MKQRKIAISLAVMVRFNEMHQFMNNHVIDHKHGRLDETPIEVDVVLNGA